MKSIFTSQISLDKFFNFKVPFFFSPIYSSQGSIQNKYLCVGNGDFWMNFSQFNKTRTNQ